MDTNWEQYMAEQSYVEQSNKFHQIQKSTGLMFSIVFRSFLEVVKGVSDVWRFLLPYHDSYFQSLVGSIVSILLYQYSQHEPASTVHSRMKLRHH